MPIPLESYVTAFPSMAGFKADYSGLADLGKFAAMLGERQSQGDLEERRLAQQIAHEGMSDQTARMHAEGTNEYYKQQADTHRMDVEDRSRALKEKRVAALRDAMRRAKTPGEMKNIAAQLAVELGGTLDTAGEKGPVDSPDAPSKTHWVWDPDQMKHVEAPGAFGEPPPPASGAAQGDVGFTPFKGPAGFVTPKPDEKFANALAEEMGAPPPKPAGSSAPAGLSGLDRFQAPSKDPERYVIKDKSGNILDMLDVGGERKQREDTIRAVMAPYIGTPKNPEAKAAAERAVQFGAAISDKIGFDKAIELTMQQYQKDVGSFAKELRPGGQYPNPPNADKSALPRQRYEAETSNQIITRNSRDFNVKAADEMDTFARNALAKLDLASGVGDYGGFADWLKSESGKVVTDSERSAFLNAAGGVEGLKNKLGRWFSGGRFSPAYIGEVKDLMETISLGVAKKRASVADRAMHEGEKAGLSKDAVEGIGGHFSGDFGGPSGGAQAGPPPPPPGVAEDPIERAKRLLNGQ